MKIPMRITHRVTLDSPFPDILQPGLLYLATHLNGTLLRLHNACFFNFDRDYGNHWELFFEPVDGNYSDFHQQTRLDSYQRYADGRDTPEASKVRWLSPRQNPLAFQYRTKMTQMNMGPHLTIAYIAEDSYEQWFTADHNISQFQMLAVQQVIEKLWKRQHYYKKYVEGAPNL